MKGRGGGSRGGAIKEGGNNKGEWKEIEGKGENEEEKRGKRKVREKVKSMGRDKGKGKS